MQPRPWFPGSYPGPTAYERENTYPRYFRTSGVGSARCHDWSEQHDVKIQLVICQRGGHKAKGVGKLGTRGKEGEVLIACMNLDIFIVRARLS